MPAYYQHLRESTQVEDGTEECNNRLFNPVSLIWNPSLCAQFPVSPTSCVCVSSVIVSLHLHPSVALFVPTAENGTGLHSSTSLTDFRFVCLSSPSCLILAPYSRSFVSLAPVRRDRLFVLTDAGKSRRFAMETSSRQASKTKEKGQGYRRIWKERKGSERSRA